MNRNSMLVMGAVLLILAGLLTWGAYRSSMGKVAEMKARNTSVVVAAKDLQLGQPLEASDVRVAQLPSSEMPDGVFHTPNEVIGRSAIATVARNELLLASKLSGDKSGAGLTVLIPPNMRAVSVKVNEVVAVAGFVVPGTRVDVLVTGNPGHNGQETATTTVLENVEVLAAGQKLQRNTEGRPDNVTVITLLVSPDDAQKLTLASSEGKIQLALRNPADAQTPTATPIQTDALFRLPATAKPRLSGAVKRVRPAAAPLPPPPQAVPVRTIEVYRGPKVETTKF